MQIPVSVCLAFEEALAVSASPKGPCAQLVYLGIPKPTALRVRPYN